MDKNLYHDIINQLAIAKGMNSGAQKIIASSSSLFNEKNSQKIIQDCVEKLEKTANAIGKMEKLLMEYRKTLDAKKAA